MVQRFANTETENKTAANVEEVVSVLMINAKTFVDYVEGAVFANIKISRLVVYHVKVGKFVNMKKDSV